MAGNDGVSAADGAGVADDPPIPRDDELQQALRWLQDGRKVARATVVSTWGSSPRPVGSQLVVDQDGNMVGSVSGGCIEGAVVHEAKQAMSSGESKLLEFGVSDEQAWEVGLACGGTVQVYVERIG
jgi:xanthine/CO dehydrogenase XdhC/CoxF family maturation factor